MDFESFYTQRTLWLDRHSGPLLVASVDGKWVPMVKPTPARRKVRLGRGEKRNKKRMSTVGTVFTQRPNIRTPEAVVESLFAEPSRPRRPQRYHRPEQKRVWASLLSGKDAFIAQVRAEMERRDPRRRKAWIVVTDGERALQRKVAATLGSIELVLDLLHVLEKLWAVSYVFSPEGSPEAREFVRERILRILQGEVSQVVKGLRQMATKRNLKGQKRATVRGVAAYYYRNRSRMRYDVYLRKGYPIASGSVEGACKNLVKDRMEQLRDALDPAHGGSDAAPTGSLLVGSLRGVLALPCGRRSEAALRGNNLAKARCQKIATPTVNASLLGRRGDWPNTTAHEEAS